MQTADSENCFMTPYVIISLPHSESPNGIREVPEFSYWSSVFVHRISDPVQPIVTLDPFLKSV
jgi:hypothetical protein